MKNKKAQGLTVYQLIMGLIALIVIAIVVFFIYPFFTKGSFTNPIPNLNGTIPGKEGIQIIRFSLEKNTLEYFNGVNFYPFESEIQKFDEKIELSERNTLNDFNNYYFGANSEIRGQKLIELDSELAEDIYPTSEIKRIRIKEILEGIELRYNPSINSWEGWTGTSGNIFKTINETTANGLLFDGTKIEGELSELLKSLVGRDIPEGIRIIDEADKGILNPQIEPSEFGALILGIPEGKISATIIDNTDNKIYGEVSLSQDNMLILKKTKGDFSGLEENEIILPQNSRLYQEIAPKLMQWRDSVLSKPIKITDINQEFCVRKVNSYLVINLDTPSSNCA